MNKYSENFPESTLRSAIKVTMDCLDGKGDTTDDVFVDHSDNTLLVTEGSEHDMGDNYVYELKSTIEEAQLERTRSLAADLLQQNGLGRVEDSLAELQEPNGSLELLASDSDIEEHLKKRLSVTKYCDKMSASTLSSGSLDTQQQVAEDIDGDGGSADGTNSDGSSVDHIRRNDETYESNNSVDQGSNKPRLASTSLRRKRTKMRVIGKLLHSAEHRSADPSSQLSTHSHGVGNELWDLIQVNRSMPDDLRNKRSDRFVDVDFRTKLHRLCATREVTLMRLQLELASEPEAAARRDSCGRLPLHILGDNDGLLATSTGRATATAFCIQLMRAYPEGLTELDSAGLMPFVRIIRDWEEWMYSCHHIQFLKDSGRSRSQFLEVFDDALNQAFKKHEVDDTNSPSLRSFPKVVVWDEVQWCFDMLSLAMDELGGKNGGLHEIEVGSSGEYNEMDTVARSELADHLPTVMPTLLKTILLVEGDSGKSRMRLISSSIIRRIFLCPHAVGLWLTKMLNNRKDVAASRAVDYLEIVSQTTIQDFIGSFRTVTINDCQTYHEAREDLMMAIDNVKGIVASLVVLDESETERAAATKVVCDIMNKNLSRPFAVSLALIDLALHFVLMMVFRVQVTVGTEQLKDSLVVVYLICSNYLLRKTCELLALLNLSFAVARGHLFDAWTILEFFSVVLTLYALVWNSTHPNVYRQGFNAFVIGLLWIRVLGFIKVVNKEMSTFILALLRIIKEMLYFVFVMAVIISMFSDMMHVAVSTKDAGGFCTASIELVDSPVADFCSSNPVNWLLRVYAVILGDFDLNDYKETAGMTILFVFVTLLGVVIMLNVLIALISDSYEMANIRSHLLFGRARVMFVAKNQALESFLLPRTTPVNKIKTLNRSVSTKMRQTGTALVVSLKLFRWLVLLSQLATTTFSEVFLVMRASHHASLENVSGLIQTVLVLLILTPALWVLVLTCFGTIFCQSGSGCINSPLNMIDSFNQKFSRVAHSVLFGVDANLNNNSITGRLSYMERSVDQVVEEAKKELLAEISALEKRLFDNGNPARQSGLVHPSDPAMSRQGTGPKVNVEGGRRDVRQGFRCSSVQNLPT